MSTRCTVSIFNAPCLRGALHISIWCDLCRSGIPVDDTNAVCRSELNRCRFAMRKGVVHLCKARGVENRHSAPRWHWSQNLGYWISMLKLNAPAEIHWRRSNMNKRDPVLMKYVEVLKDCRSLNAAAEINCPMPRSVEKVPVRNGKRCIDNQHAFQ